MNGIVGGVVMVISVAVMLGIGVKVLGEDDTIDCTNVIGYNADDPPASTGWGEICADAESTSRDAWGLLPVIVMILATVVVLGALRHFV